MNEVAARKHAEKLAGKKQGVQRRPTKTMLRRAIAGVLALILAQVTIGIGFEELGARSRAQNEEAGSPLPTSATAEALRQRPPPAWRGLAETSAAPTEPRTPPSVVSAAPAESRTPPSVPVTESSSPCRQEMALVEGEYCTNVLQVCARWLDDESLPFARCAEYRAPSRCIGKRVKQRFCIDRFEYTAPGETLPLNYQSFDKANTLCRGLGKRLCTESEWNFACEGEEMRPYPYGFSREAVCNQDRTDLYEPNQHYQVLADRREPATSRPRCVSPFGVYDMVGNMDEPVLREGAAHVEPYRNALKGGWWMPARNRCRPATTAHDDYYKDIQVGIRCCATAP